MTRKLLSVILALAAALPCLAQAEGWQFEGAVSLSAYDRYGFGVNSEIVDRSAYSYSGGMLYDMQSTPIILPTFSVTGGYKFPGTFIGAYMNVFWNYARNSLHGGPAVLRERESILHLLPELRFYYLDRPKVRLYASLAGGLRYRMYAETLEGDTVFGNDFRFSYHICPFGVAVGSRLYFSVDLGYGPAWTATKLGVGYKF